MNTENSQTCGLTPQGGPGAPPHGQTARRSAPPASRLWLWVFAAFAFQFAAWTAWFVVASHNRVAEVPLVHTR